MADYDSNLMYVIDGSTNTLATMINLGDCQCEPSGVAVNPSTNQIFVADYGNGWVTVVDGGTDELANEPAITSQGALTDRAGFVPLSPAGIAVNPSTSTIYVTQDGAPGGIFIIDGTTHKIDGVVPTGQDYSVAVAINPSTNSVYVANYGSNPISVIDGATNSVVGNVGVGEEPTYIAVNSATNTLYVVDSNSGSVSVIALASSISPTTTPEFPTGVLGAIAFAALAAVAVISRKVPVRRTA